MKRFQWKSKTVIHPLVYIPSHSSSFFTPLFLAMSFTLFHTFSNYIICFADKSTSLMMSLSFLALAVYLIKCKETELAEKVYCEGKNIKESLSRLNCFLLLLTDKTWDRLTSRCYRQHEKDAKRQAFLGVQQKTEWQNPCQEKNCHTHISIWNPKTEVHETGDRMTQTRL